MIYKPGGAGDEAAVAAPSARVEPRGAVLSGDGQRLARRASARVVLGRSRNATSRSMTRTSRAGTPSCGRRVRLLDRRSRLDERGRGERQAPPAREARGGRHVHRRRDRDRLHDGARIWLPRRRPRGAARVEDRLPRAALPLHLADRPDRRTRSAPSQESFVLRPAVAGGPLAGGDTAGRRLVVAEPGAQLGSESSSTPTSFTIGRGGRTTSPSRRRVRLCAASADRAAARRVWVHDLGSTNGTFVNGERRPAAQARERRRVRVGETDLRFEE